MLHAQLLAELLDDEVSVAVERLGGRATNLQHDGRYVRCALPAPDGSTVWLTLDAIAYDGQPLAWTFATTPGSGLASNAGQPGLPTASIRCTSVPGCAPVALRSTSPTRATMPTGGMPSESAPAFPTC